MITTKKFKEKIKDMGYDIIEDEESQELKITRKSVVYGITGVTEQYSITFRNTPITLKKIVRYYEDTRIEDRTGYYEIPLPGLTLGGQQYITFNRITEQFKAMDKLSFHSEDLVQLFTKDELESDFFKEVLGDYLKWVVEA
ncbi:hypothetical protein [Gemella massiliensis]|uniref:hypothetical protein n=1 Tax=Gemella massiliensis TaxID=1909670 RepID=UPI0009318E29|nr:hypothetical protein [Gemella massiliensis]